MRLRGLTLYHSKAGEWRIEYRHYFGGINIRYYVNDTFMFQCNIPDPYNEIVRSLRPI